MEMVDKQNPEEKKNLAAGLLQTEPETPGISGSHPPKTAILVIDVQKGAFTPSQNHNRNYPGLTPANQEQYLQSVANFTAKARSQGHPATWVTIGDASAFHLPAVKWRAGDAAAPRDTNERARMRLHENDPSPGEANMWKKNGPKKDEAVLQKKGFNALNPNEPGPAQLLQSLHDSGVQHVVLVGGNADVCVTATAVAAAQSGLKVTVVSDLLLSDDNPARNKTPEQYKQEAQARFRNMAEGAPLTGALSHERLKSEGIDLHSAQTRDAIRDNIKIQTSSEFLASHAPAQPAQQHQAGHAPPAAAQTPAPAQSTAANAPVQSTGSEPATHPGRPPRAQRPSPESRKLP